MLEINIDTEYVAAKKDGSLTKKIELFLDHYVKAGVFGGNASKPAKKRQGKTKALKVGRLAVLNEYGHTIKPKKTIRFPHPNIPGKWFILARDKEYEVPPRQVFGRLVIKDTKYFEKIKNEIVARVSILFSPGIRKGDTPRKCWQGVGKIVKDAMQESYKDMDSIDPNSEMTKLLKGEMYPPLMETDTVYDSIDYKVFKDKEGTESKRAKAELDKLVNELKRKK